LDQEVAQSVADLTMHTPDITIEDAIDRLADKLAAFCLECLEEDLGDHGNNVIDVNID